MKQRFLLIAAVSGFLFASLQIPQLRAQESEPKNLAFRAVPFTDVKFSDSFWSPRLSVNREISIPHNYKWCEDTGRFTNFAKAAKLIPGRFEGIYFNDSDVYKLLEGTAYSLADHPDPELKKQADRVIEWIEAAQLPNGYLNSYYTLVEPDKVWTDTKVRHELYCAGHLAEAAVAYSRATGDTKLQQVSEKFIDHIAKVFGPNPGQKVEVPGHEEIELALVKLHQLTGEEKYLDLAKFFVDVRGKQEVRTDKLQGPYSQDHIPVREQFEIFGHAVRAMYLYAGVADVAAYTGDKELIAAMDALWNDVVNKKMYITGGIGARHEGEAFGDAFELPNGSAYAETCAAIGLVFWAHRLNLMHGDAKYADVVERAMYNGVLSGIGRDGKSFFYVNPLSSRGHHHRQPFFDCACCPTNVVRFVPSLPGYQFATEGNCIIVNQYVGGKATIELPGGKVFIETQTDYPWNGSIRFTINSVANSPTVQDFKIKVREPEWAVGTAQYDEAITIPWGKQVVHTYEFPMEPRRIVANPQVEADRGRVAIQRGPLVYCFEQCDNKVQTDRIVLARDPEFRYEFDPELLGGIGVIRCKNRDGRELTAIPYYAWDHRKAGKMDVWVRQEGLSRDPKTEDPAWTNAETREPILYRELLQEMLGVHEEDPPISEEEKKLSIMERAYPSASHCFSGDSVDSITGREIPKNSNDHSLKRHTFWNHKGTREWVEYSFDEPEKISKCSVYWFDDEGQGECRVPQSWSLSYLKDEQWVPVKTESKFETSKDKPHIVEFTPVETTGLRIDLQLQKGFSGGILRWTLN